MKKIATLLLAAFPLVGIAQDIWAPVKDVSLQVSAGSILDFSSLAPANVPITSPLIVKNGQFAVANNPNVPKRFLMASAGFDSASGAIPSRANADAYVQQWKMHGYNMVRLHFVDAMLMENRVNDFDFSPTQLENLYYLLAQMKKAGIYYIMDVITSGNGGYGNLSKRWVDTKYLGKRVFIDDEAQAHWKKMVDKLFNSVNPYTGTTLLKDPALAGLILVNEGGAIFTNRYGFAPTYTPVFNAWLKKKYTTTTALATAWSTELKSTETIEAANVGLVSLSAGSGKRMSDTLRFVTDLEKSTADWMTAYLRGYGYKGLVTAYDAWVAAQSTASRAQFDWIDMHSYFAGAPSNFTDPGSVGSQDSMLAGWGQYIVDLTTSRVYGKAYTVSEYGQVFWNKFRRETGLAFSATAAFQEWSMIAQHQGAVTLSYAEGSGRKDRIYPYVIGPDPIQRANETLAALLYLRGDVAPARNRYALKMTQAMIDKSTPYTNVNNDVRRVSMISQVGIDYEGKAANRNLYHAELIPDDYRLKVLYRPSSDPAQEPAALDSASATLAAKAAAQSPWVAPANSSNTGNWDLDVFNNRVTSMRTADASATNTVATNAVAASSAAASAPYLFDRANLRENVVSGIFQSDTGQLNMDAPRKRMIVNTPRTEGVVFATPEALTISSLRVNSASGPALVSVSSMDGLPVAQSKRMLVIFATDARNTNMTFSDANETTLKDIGTGPVVIKTGVINLTLNNVNAAGLKVYSNTLNGVRKDLIASTVSGNGLTFTLDTSKLSHGPTTYFEIIKP